MRRSLIGSIGFTHCETASLNNHHVRTSKLYLDLLARASKLQTTPHWLLFCPGRRASADCSWRGRCARQADRLRYEYLARFVSVLGFSENAFWYSNCYDVPKTWRAQCDLPA